ncbi:cofactor-independent phosphoglycerate mutase [uncultured Roseburia sp.]|uniref:Cofactor-independent phosphoglycerate mutase n=1 Tax=Brotonthovivens ammoniilytica TaxID=2981725 RepID=A0ABT2TKM7_9FIRM|nr:cofactor-independent phosphoglycerate mutase [Brotonthovivens ammoniilytica]MCU6762657.1 cofactor-independent phosphoglycerate mutase [Brotonthovivens ammoniilytica]SCI83732.1 cofactor-independent phosphoglycerate mutase [uncultured Roseburia sp.]
MKYVVVLGDGMADRPIEELGNKTPLEYARTPMMDQLAAEGEIGMVHTIPDGMKPGSDTANLSVLGYDPRKYYSGRSPLEALSIGVDMKDTDIALRCNLVTLSEEESCYEARKIIDHSSGEISTEDAAVLLNAVREELETEGYKFYTGTSYRHLLIWEKGEVVDLVQPHDVLGQTIGQHLPEDKMLREMMKKSYDILVNHPINIERKKQGLNPANSCWFWGAGTKPALSSFEEKTSKKGAMISAVDLLKGIAVGSSMKVIHVEGANGGLDTNYEGKAQAAVDVLTKDGYDFVYVHVEAPDEMGHQGSVERKVKAIEYLDERLIRIIKEGLDAFGEAYRMLILPDHPTPICIRTHSSENVPYLLYDSVNKEQHHWKYNEADAEKSGKLIAHGHELIDYLFADQQI